MCAAQITPSFYDFMAKDKAASKAQRTPVYTMKDEAYAQDAQSPAYWHLNSPSTFLSYSWLFDDLLRSHNEHFFHLTAQNLKICNDVWVGMIQFRLGQSDEWVYMGMTTVICDAAAKVRKAPVNGFGQAGNVQMMSEGVVNTAKKPSAGLDLNREVLDTRRTSNRFYLKGWVAQEDAQKIIQLKRTSEAGLQTGYVQFVNGEIERMPETELAADCMLPEVQFCVCVCV